MERLIAADNDALIAAYEEQVRKLHQRRIALQEKLARPPENAITDDIGYRTAMSFIANSGKLWVSDQFSLRRMVPRLLFGGRLPYH